MDSYVIGNGGTYMLDFYADLNGNGLYDAPPVDHAWRLQNVTTLGDLDREFVHNQDFTDIFLALGLASDVEALPVSVFPNPATSHLYITMDPGQADKGNLSVYNSAGITVLSQLFTASGTVMDLDIEHLQAGIYFLQIEMQDRRSYSRFIKQ